MDRTVIESLVDEMYSVRKSNDVARVLKLFSDEASFRMSGDTGPGRIASSDTGGEEFSEMMRTMVQTWRWLDHRILDRLIDGNNAAIRYRAKMVFTPTGQTVETDIFDLITFENGKIKKMVEFVDTAIATELMNAAMTQRGGAMA